MNATQRVFLRNILREDLVCIWFLLYLCNRKRETNRLKEALTRARVAEEGKADVSEDDISKVTYL